MADDPIIQMASDPDFGKLPLSEQRKALAAHDPGFGQLGDDDISGFVRAHQELQLPDTAAQSAAQTKGVVKRLSEGMQPSFFGGAYPTKQQDQYINQRLPQVQGQVQNIRKQALTAAGGAFGGEAAQLAKGLPWFLRAIAGASGAGAGAGAGNIAGGGSPKEALTAGSQFAAMSLPLEGLAAGAQALRAPLAQMVRDPLTGKVRTPWEMAVDKVLPDPYAPNAIPAKPIPKGTNYGQYLENQKIAAKTPPPPAELGSPENPGFHAKLPARIPKPPKETPPQLPFLSSASRSNAPTGNVELPQVSGPQQPFTLGLRTPPQPLALSPFRGMSPSSAPGDQSIQPFLPKGDPTPFPLVKPKAQATGSAQEPFEPLVFESQQEANAHELRMRNLKRQASSAGTYHAAQGASGKKTNLQQRIQKKDSPFFGEQ